MNRRLLRAGLAGVAAGVALLGGEMVSRVASGYRLTAFALEATAPSAGPVQLPSMTWPVEGANEIASRHVSALAVPEGVNRQWFFSDPPVPAPKPPRPELDALTEAYSNPTVGKFARRAWNLNFVLDQARSRQSYWDFLKQVHTPLRVFDPPGHSAYPRYRMLPDDPHAEAWTSGTFATNNLGYRGPDLERAKPAGVFRIVFVGASTTIDHYSFPLSFTDYVGHYLNRWAEARGLKVRFEAVNAAREGLQSGDLAAVVDQEVRFLAPDIVVYKEGANQFGAGKRLLRVSGAPLPQVPPQFLLTGVLEDWPGMRHSAAIRSLRQLASRWLTVGEPAKPAYSLDWPAGLDEQVPDLSSADLPLDLPKILSDLGHIKNSLDAVGAGFAVSSFTWMAEEGLRLNTSKPNERALYWYLNGNEVLWPLRYRDVRRLADFQNRVFQRFAAARGAGFVDLDRLFPRDPALFIDGIHISYAGIKLHGWITFLQLLPMVEQRLAAGAQTVTPAVADGGEESVVSIEAILAKLAAGAQMLPVPVAADWRGASPDVTVAAEGDRLRVRGSAARWAYQAVSTPIAVEPNRDYRVRLDLRVTSGIVGIGVLDQSGATWISSPLDTQDFTFNSGASRTVQLVVADATPALAAVRQSVFDVEIPKR